MNPFDVHFILFKILGYEMSLIELSGVAANMACVILAAREKVSSWPVGIVGIVLFFILFYQIQLYSDMLLQIFFLITTFYGWWIWTHPGKKEETNQASELKITRLAFRQLAIVLGVSLAATVLNGILMSHIHRILPVIFPQPAAYPLADSFTTVMSITATFLMMKKKKECWLFWIAVDLVATGVYFMKGVNLMALEYIVFGMIAFSGHLKWSKTFRLYSAGVQEE
jgi:nicotinamide mononucleotide transporter